jgi:hypothetical protein
VFINLVLEDDKNKKKINNRPEAFNAGVQIDILSILILSVEAILQLVENCLRG